MLSRIKWVLIGIGFTFGIQAMVSLLFTGVAYSAARSVTFAAQDLVLVVALALVIGTFLIGGFVVGCMSEELRLVDSAVVAIASLALSYGVYAGLPPGNKAQFVTGYFFNSPGYAATLIGLSIAGALVGAYWGWHVSVPQERVFDRFVLLMALMAAIVGPFVLLVVGSADSSNPDQRNLTWYFVLAGLAFILAIILVGFFMFTAESRRESRYEKEISISPEHRHGGHSPLIGGTR